MRSLIWSSGCTVVLFCAVVADGGETPPKSPAVVVRTELGSKLDEYMTRLEGWGFSGVLLVAKDDEIILRKSYGPADRSTGRPVFTDTPFTVGSITKQFTAAAIMKLQMAGKLNAQDPITKYFPDVPADKRDMTLHHLLTHTAGFPDASGDDYESCTRDEIVRWATGCKLQGKPGERYSYSNVGYSLLGAVVELVGGQPYETFLVENLFQPAGMTRTGYVAPKFNTSELPHGYTLEGDWGTSLDHAWMSDGPSWHLRCNGGVLSTVDDMFRWHQALGGDSILSGEVRKLMFTPHVAEGPMGRSHYGYGWVVTQTVRGTTLITHNGGNGIFAADCRRYVDEGVFYHIASSVASMSAIDAGDVIPRIIFGLDYALPPTVVAVGAPELEKCSGSYRLPSGGTLTGKVEDGGLTLTANGPDAFGLLATGDPEEMNRRKAITEKTRKVLEAADRGDFGPLHRAFGGDRPIENLKQMESEHRAALEQELGKYQSFEPIGSVAAGDGDVFTYVRRRFERGEGLLRLRWNGEQLVGIRDVRSAGAARFRPQSPMEFCSFALGSNASQRLTLRLDPSGRATGMTFHAKGGDILAMRVE